MDKFEFIKCNLFGTFSKLELERLKHILDEYFADKIFDLTSDTLMEDNRFYHKFNTYLELLIVSIKSMNFDSFGGFLNEKENS